jgi:hypothetical protein
MALPVRKKASANGLRCPRHRREWGNGFGFARALKSVAPPHGRVEPVRVWRGIVVKHADPFEAVTGISWTTDRDCAAWFAMRFAVHEDDVRPFVFWVELEAFAIICFPWRGLT